MVQSNPLQQGQRNCGAGKTGLTTGNCGLRFAQFGRLCSVVCDKHTLCGFSIGDNVGGRE